MKYIFSAAPLGLAVLAVSLSGTATQTQTPEPPPARPVAPGGPGDPIVDLEARLAAGATTVVAEGRHGYLKGLLAQLDIPVSSQGLVFSRTSLQTDRIAPWAPRALYFNDDVYIGAVVDSPFLEIASIDPGAGASFYTVRQDGGARPVFQREGTTCLMCHESRAATGGVPGIIVRSVLTDRMGYMVGAWHEGSTSDRTPFDRRFGGYYVTGTHAGAPHAGNTLSPLLAHEVPVRDEYMRTFDRGAGANVTDLSKLFNTSQHLSPHSDVVALMVLAHQARVHNLIVQTQRATGPGDQPAPIAAAVEQLLRVMLFSGEAPLGGPVRGTTNYARAFSARGPADRDGRSLRDFDLETRLFRYPLSFLVYSAAFEALPPPAREQFYARLDDVLTGADRSPEFAHLSAADRRAIREILVDTKPEFAARNARSRLRAPGSPPPPVPAHPPR
jgi:hypothetical protein